jgi:spermidine/putrescine transport system ATP-binding protein
VNNVPEPLTIAMKNMIGRPVLDVGAQTRIAWDERAIVVF